MPVFLDQVDAVRSFGKVLLGRRQHALEPHQDNVLDDVTSRLFGAAAHVVDFKTNDRFADRRLDFALGSGEFAHARALRPNIRHWPFNRVLTSSLGDIDKHSVGTGK